MTLTCQTRLESYRKMQPHLAKRRREVYNYILEETRKGNSVTDREIAKGLGRPINTVDNRRGDLVKMGLVVAYGCKFDVETRRRAVAWKAEASK